MVLYGEEAKEAKNDDGDGDDDGDDVDAVVEEAAVVLFYEDAVDGVRVNEVPAVILNAEGAAAQEAQEAQEQVGEAADDEPIPEVLADDGAGLLHDLPNNVVAALAELKKAENEFVDRRVGGRVRRRNQFLD